MILKHSIKQIDLFKPPQFNKSCLDIGKLNDETNKKWNYASSGKASIFHILNSLNVQSKILIPVYLCDSVLIPLKKLKVEPIFYDFDTDDLNGSLESIEHLSKKYQIKNLIVASLYGNPGNLLEIEKYCIENGINLVDDAAQSYGATLADRFIGTFGKAGFFSFSPGKATAGHLGAFFWTENQYQFDFTKHNIVHRIQWLDFYLNRYKCYSQNYFFYKKFVSIIKLLIFKYTDIYYDQMSIFEETIIGGILEGVQTYMKDFRLKYWNEFYNEFSSVSHFRVIKAKRGNPNNHKIVLIFENPHLANDFISFFTLKNITVSKGYRMLSNVISEVPNSIIIENRIVELPIEDNIERMEYLFNTTREALKTI